ncbi:uncharacterized protein LOC141679701 [Apium graveolens]|uniref:uncharacterized protein LOC141679701 n=1 Tax=Apium graveolens TaxID=4045 RepID=UPI003D7A1EAD
MEMAVPRTQKDIQKLVGCLAALRRFIPTLAERCMPFFEMLKGARNKKLVDWTPECQAALEEVKRHLMNPPILSKAKPGEPLYLYIAAGVRAVSSALIREESGTRILVYYISQVLKDAENRYPNIEKFALALVHSSRKLRQYFQGREIKVITDQPLRKIIHKPDASGRLVNWAIELSQFNLKFVPRTTIKAQTLAEFVMECTFPEALEVPITWFGGEKETNDNNSWTLYVDGSVTVERSGAGLILSSPDGFIIQQAITFVFKATNDQVEYEALLSGLRLSISLGVKRLIIYSDSQIVVKQTNGEYIAKDPKLAQYQATVRSILETIPDTTILQINREENSKEDELSKLVQNTSDLSSSVYFEELGTPSTDRPEVLCISSPDNWMTPYIAYLKDGTLQEYQNKARYLKYKATRLFLEDNQLYRRTFSVLTLKCIDPDKADYCLREVHEGICGDHLAAKELAYKVIRQGYYGPTIHANAVAYVNKCSKCQKFNNVPNQSPNLPGSVLSPVPFVVWGIDIMGPFPRAKGNLRYVLVVIDYMTKWAEAKAMKTINQQDYIKFMYSIVMRFGIPMVLISDNGPQFVGSDFEAYLKELGIKHKKAFVAHPQGNGEVVFTNRTILRGLENRLEESKKDWPDELPKVLWSYRTTPRTGTEETPFKLAYGIKAQLPIETGSPSHGVVNFDEVSNIEGLKTNLELLDEVRDRAVEKMESYKKKTKLYFEKKAKIREYEVGDLAQGH